MRSNKPKFFIQTIKKKPHIYAFFKNLEHHSIQDIESSGFQRWIREMLVQLKQNGFVWSEKAEQDFLNQSVDVLITYNEDPIGEVFQYSGMETRLKIRGTSEISVDDGDYIWVGKDRIILGTMPLENADATSLANLLSLSAYHSNMTHTDFNEFYQEHLAKKHGLTRTEDSLGSIKTSSASKIADKYGVTIQRL